MKIFSILPLLATMTFCGTAAAKDQTDAIFKKNYGSQWAFTFDRGVLICDRYAVYIENPMTEEIYPLNGLASSTMKAKGKEQSLDAVWLDDPRPNGVKINIDPFIQRGLKLCE